MKGCPGLSTPVWMAWSSVKPFGVALSHSFAYKAGVSWLAMQLLCFRKSGYSALFGDRDRDSCFMKTFTRMCNPYDMLFTWRIYKMFLEFWQRSDMTVQQVLLLSPVFPLSETSHCPKHSINSLINVPLFVTFSLCDFIKWFSHMWWNIHMISRVFLFSSGQNIIP